MMDLGLGGTSTGANEDSKVDDIGNEFPWMIPVLKNLRMSGLMSNQDAISSAIVDIMENRLDTGDLHSAMPSRDWVMGDGLAAYLRSGKMYCKYNGKNSIRIRDTKDETEKKYQDITRWNPEGSRSVSISTFIRIHRSTRGLARCIKSQIGEKMRTCPIRGDEGIKGHNGRVKVSLKISDDARGRRSLIELNSIPDGDDYLNVLEDIPIWEVRIAEESSEVQMQQTIYSG
jgi:hypothetical protein